jgi:hypothetical protein
LGSALDVPAAGECPVRTIPDPRIVTVIFDLRLLANSVFA